MSHILKKESKSTKRYEIILKTYKLPQAKSSLPRHIQLLKFGKCLSWIFHKQLSTTFEKLKNCKFKNISRNSIKFIQQFILSIQKKVLTRRLWAFYKIKNFENGMSTPFTLNTRRSSPSFSRSLNTVNFIKQRSPRIREVVENKLSKFVLVLNKLMHIKSLKSFWSLYLWGSVGSGRFRTDNSEKIKRLTKTLEAFQRKNKIWALSCLNLYPTHEFKKVKNASTRSFLKYITPSHRLITLPTIFLEGDPGPDSNRGSRFGSLNNRRNSLKYFK